MIKIKQIFSILSLLSMVTTVSIFAMEENSEQSVMTHAVASSCWNALSDVKNAAHYGINMVAAEARYIPEVINAVFTGIAKRDKEQNEVKLSTNGLNLSIYQIFEAIQNGAYYGANYAHTVINGLFIHVASADE